MSITQTLLAKGVRSVNIDRELLEIGTKILRGELPPAETREDALEIANAVVRVVNYCLGLHASVRARDVEAHADSFMRGKTKFAEAFVHV